MRSTRLSGNPSSRSICFVAFDCVASLNRFATSFNLTSTNFWSVHHFRRTLPIIHLVWPQNFVWPIVSNFSWVLQSSQEKAKTMLMQNFGGQERRILCFHSRGQRLCKFIGTKESVYIRKEFNSHKTGLGHKHGRRFIVLGHIYGRHDVTWKHNYGQWESGQW